MPRYDRPLHREPLQYEFFRHGLLAATLVGALCGLMGVYIVLRRMSYIGHGLSHAVFGGAVVSYADRLELLPRRRALGLPLGAPDQRHRAAPQHRRRRGDRHRHHRLVRPRRGPDQQDALASPATSRRPSSATSSGVTTRDLCVIGGGAPRSWPAPSSSATSSCSSPPSIRSWPAVYGVPTRLGRHRLRPGAGGDDRRLDERRRRDPDRGGDRHPADDRAAADRLVRAAAAPLDAASARSAGRRDVPQLPLDIASGAAIVLLAAAVFAAVYGLTSLRRLAGAPARTRRPTPRRIGTRVVGEVEGHLID